MSQMRADATAVVFLDFDGTVTRRDATDAILEAFARPEWRQFEDDWQRGLMGSRDCLTAQLGLVTATVPEVDALLDSIEIDPGLGTLVEICARRHLPLYIVSDGFDHCIERILSRAARQCGERLRDLPVTSSHLRFRGDRWYVSFSQGVSPCPHGCGTCKPAAMERLNVERKPTIFIGDGLSDRFAVLCADLVFAKDALAAHCREHAIPFIPFEDLAAVAIEIDRLTGVAVERDRTCARR